MMKNVTHALPLITCPLYLIIAILSYSLICRLNSVYCKNCYHCHSCKKETGTKS